MKPPEKIEVICPECGTKGTVLWFPSEGYVTKVTGSTGRPSNKYFGRKEKVEGKCECGYKFKPDDLDE